MTFESATVWSQVFALILFLALFAGVLYYALRPSQRKKFEDAAQIPLRED